MTGPGSIPPDRQSESIDPNKGAPEQGSRKAEKSEIEEKVDTFAQDELFFDPDSEAYASCEDVSDEDVFEWDQGNVTQLNEDGVEMTNVRSRAFQDIGAQEPLGYDGITNFEAPPPDLMSDSPVQTGVDPSVAMSVSDHPIGEDVSTDYVPAADPTAMGIAGSVSASDPTNPMVPPPPNPAVGAAGSFQTTRPHGDLRRVIDKKQMKDELKREFGEPEEPSGKARHFKRNLFLVAAPIVGIGITAILAASGVGILTIPVFFLLGSWLAMSLPTAGVDVIVRLQERAEEQAERHPLQDLGVSSAYWNEAEAFRNELTDLASQKKNFSEEEYPEEVAKLMVRHGITDEENTKALTDALQRGIDGKVEQLIKAFNFEANGVKGIRDEIRKYDFVRHEA